MNLLLNAAEATPEGGSITISANRLTYVDNIEIRVDRHGIRYSAGSYSTRIQAVLYHQTGKGTGLGLSISHAYIRSHNGEIRVDSVVNHGTTVTITLPLQTMQTSEESKEESQIVV